MINNPEPSKLRRYLVEYALLALCGCVIFLFYLYVDLNRYIREDLTKINTEQGRTLQTVNETMNEIKFLFKTNKN